MKASNNPASFTGNPRRLRWNDTEPLRLEQAGATLSGPQERGQSLYPRGNPMSDPLTAHHAIALDPVELHHAPGPGHRQVTVPGILGDPEGQKRARLWGHFRHDVVEVVG